MRASLPVLGEGHLVLVVYTVTFCTGMSEARGRQSGWRVTATPYPPQAPHTHDSDGPLHVWWVGEESALAVCPVFWRYPSDVHALVLVLRIRCSGGTHVQFPLPPPSPNSTSCGIVLAPAVPLLYSPALHWWGGGAPPSPAFHLTSFLLPGQLVASTRGFDSPCPSTLLSCIRQPVHPAIHPHPRQRRQRTRLDDDGVDSAKGEVGRIA